MKLSINTDFTKLPRAGGIVHAADADAGVRPFDTVSLPHDERHLRRKVLSLSDGGKLLVDLAEPVMLAAGDRFLLDDGRQVAIVAAPEELLEVRGRDAVHLAELAWHIGNRHLAAQIEADRILILHDHVIEDMLEGLGATVREVADAFQPVRGAYSGHAHGHEHHHHDHGERDAHGRLPGDPHYGHDHG
jgi:urease accessory protein